MRGPLLLLLVAGSGGFAVAAVATALFSSTVTGAMSTAILAFCSGGLLTVSVLRGS